MAIFLPPIRRSWRCERCGLRAPKTDADCPHCHGLDDQELERLKSAIEARQASYRSLARLLNLAAALLAVVTLVFVLAR